MAKKDQQLRESSFYLKEILQSALNKYLSANQPEIRYKFSMFKKTEGDTTNDYKIYNDVKSGALKIEDAIVKYSKLKAEPFYVKAGVIDLELERPLTLQPGGYTKLINLPNFAFAKLIGRRPSWGYLTFGTISYPKVMPKMKTQIYEALKSGGNLKK